MIAWGVTIIVGFYATFVAKSIHLFFLIIPVWLATAILYLILSYAFGAGKKLPDLPDETGAAETTTEGTEERGKPVKKPTAYYISGLIALAMLVAMFAIAVSVAVSPQETYEQRFTLFKNALIYLTIAYFVFGTIWLCLKEKSLRL